MGNNKNRFSRFPTSSKKDKDDLIKKKARTPIAIKKEITLKVKLLVRKLEENTTEICTILDYVNSSDSETICLGIRLFSNILTIEELVKFFDSIRPHYFLIKQSHDEYSHQLRSKMPRDIFIKANSIYPLYIKVDNKIIQETKLGEYLRGWHVTSSRLNSSFMATSFGGNEGKEVEKTDLIKAILLMIKNEIKNGKQNNKRS